MDEVRAVLKEHQVEPAPVLGRPRRLRILRVRFTGEKVGVPIPGSFDFNWEPAPNGVSALLSDTNLRGKSSIIEVIKWLLRGTPSDNLQDDVRSWVSQAELGFTIDSEKYLVRLDSASDVVGALSRQTGGLGQVLSQFSGEGDFVATMSSFFLDELGLAPWSAWQSSQGMGEGKAVTHGWPALGSVFFIGSDYGSLLGEGQATGVPVRLLQMYLGLPWVTTLAEAQTALRGLQAETSEQKRQTEDAKSVARTRIQLLSQELQAKREELAAIGDAGDIESRYESAHTRLWQFRADTRSLESAFTEAQRSLTEAEENLREDRRSLLSHQNILAATQVFRRLNPTHCPRCDKELDSGGRGEEPAHDTCYVCGETSESDADAQEVEDALKERVEASKKAVQSAKDRLTQVRSRLESSQSGIGGVQIELNSLIEGMRSVPSSLLLSKEISILEARLQELTTPIPQVETNSRRLDVIRAAVDEASDRLKEYQDDLLQDVSTRMLDYANRFGIDAITELQLKGNLNLTLTKGGSKTSYSKLTEGEKLRLKVAAILALIVTGESKGFGRHPGLCIIDSPGAQEVSQRDLDALMSGLKHIAAEFSHVQAIVAGLATQAILDNVPSANVLHVRGDEALW